MKISYELIEAVELQINNFKQRIKTYQLSAMRLNKMKNGTNDAVLNKSIDGYLEQINFLNQKVQLLASDLKIIVENFEIYKNKQ